MSVKLEYLSNVTLVRWNKIRSMLLSTSYNNCTMLILPSVKLFWDYIRVNYELTRPSTDNIANYFVISWNKNIKCLNVIPFNRTHHGKDEIMYFWIRIRFYCTEEKCSWRNLRPREKIKSKIVNNKNKEQYWGVCRVSTHDFNTKFLPLQ